MLEKQKTEKRLSVEFIKKISDEFNNLMRDEFKLSENEKPLLISALFIALKNESFRSLYLNQPNSNRLANLVFKTISSLIQEGGSDQKGIDALLNKFTFITTNTMLNNIKKIDCNNLKNNAPLHYMVQQLDEYFVRPLQGNLTSSDIMGVFYSRFLKYTTGDGKGLGIVLTPQHITELFCDLANDGTGLNPNQDIVIDTCAGTGGFLVSAMSHMITKAKGNNKTIQTIRRNRVYGIEINDKMFALLSANMIVVGGRKSNILNSDVFKEINWVVDKKATVGMINPPYGQKKKGESELQYISTMLDCLSPNATGITIIPISALTSKEKITVKLKDEIMSKHTLKAVMKLNNQLFSQNASIQTCIAIFEAHRPHHREMSPVWLADWHDDGFKVLKHRGRVEIRDWGKIKINLLKDYREKVQKPGYATVAYLTPDDEWIVDAHVETDYSKLSDDHFNKAISDFFTYMVSRSINQGEK